MKRKSFTLQYAKQVIAGKIIAGELIVLACKRFMADLNRQDLTYDIAAGHKAVNFYEKHLYHHEGEWAGKPFLLELWQKAIIEQIFAWKLPNGKRRIRDVYVQISRKNGKTALLAGLSLYHLFGDDENSPQVLFGSNNEDQAKIGTTSAGRFLEKSPTLSKLISNKRGRGRVNIYKYRGKVKAINYAKNGGALEAMSADPTTKDGFNPSLGVIDEFHEAPDDLLLNVIESGQGARSQPLLATITTAGYRKDGPCYSKLRANSVAVLRGDKQDDGHLGFIFEPDTEDDWEDPSTWYKSCPNLGISVSEHWMRGRYQKAKNEGSSKEVDFKTKNLNIWTDAPETWIDSKIVKANSKGFSPDDIKEWKCYGGLDIGGSQDLTAFALLFVDEKHRQLAARFMFWVPEDKVKGNNDNIDYRDWIRKEYVKVMPGRVVDNEQVASDILGMIKPYDIQRIDFDPYKSDHGIVRTLQDYEITCEPLAQTTRFLGEPFNKLEETVNLEQLEMFGNPVVEWMFGNVVVYTDTSGNRKPDKRKSQNKIDGVAALVNAFGGWITAIYNEEEEVNISWL